MCQSELLRAHSPMPLSASLSKFFNKCIVNFSSSLQISFKVTKVSFFFVYFLGKYRGAAHNACNLLLKIDPRQHVTPVVFHNFCVYLSSFFTLNSVDLVSLFITLGLANTCPSFILADCFISPSFCFFPTFTVLLISHTPYFSPHSFTHPPLTHTHIHSSVVLYICHKSFFNAQSLFSIGL